MKLWSKNKHSTGKLDHFLAMNHFANIKWFSVQKRMSKYGKEFIRLDVRTSY
jgi:hypothetical protein